MNRRVFFAVAIGLLPAALGACASGGAGAASGSDPELLTLADLEPYRAQDVYQVIRRLRSNWLNARGAQGTWQPNPTDPTGMPSRADDLGEGQVKVYIDGVVRPEGMEALKQLSVQEVKEIRHMNSRDATMMYGTDHGSGAIQVFTRGD